jgi:hypothetical protein
VASPAGSAASIIAGAGAAAAMRMPSGIGRCGSGRCGSGRCDTSARVSAAAQRSSAAAHGGTSGKRQARTTGTTPIFLTAVAGAGAPSSAGLRTIAAAAASSCVAHRTSAQALKQSKAP